MHRYAGKSAIVTGAGAGLGRALASRLAMEGAMVAVADIDTAGAKQVADELTGSGCAAFPVEVDVSEEDAVRDMVAATVERFGRLDVLSNNAAATSGEANLGDRSLLDLDVGVWDLVLAVNLRGVMLGCKCRASDFVAGRLSPS